MLPSFLSTIWALNLPRIVHSPPFHRVGCELVEPGTWRQTPLDAFIFGVKELPENDDSPLVHRHIFFGHCFKNQVWLPFVLDPLYS